MSIIEIVDVQRRVSRFIDVFGILGASCGWVVAGKRDLRDRTLYDRSHAD